MEKAIQAIDIATTATGNKGNTQGKPDGDGESTPFSEVLSPAREQVARPVEEQSGNAGGNHLPGEQALPEAGAQHAVTTENEVVSSLLDHTDLEQVTQGEQVVEVAQVEHIEAPVGGAETAEPVGYTALPAALATLPAAPAEVPVVNGKDTRPAGERNAAAVTGTGVHLPQPAADPDEAVSVVRDAVRNTANRGEAAIPSQPLPPASNGPTGTATDAVQAAVRTGVQQALAAQVAQDGLQQSLGGNRQAAHLLNGIATANLSMENTTASFAPLLSEVANVSSPARVAIPVGEAGWGRAIGEQVVWHVSQNINAASLRLNPQHLGPLEMQVQMEGDKATLAFVSQHAAVRDALESALPRLREMFAQNGLDIVDVNVSQQHTAGRDGQQTAAGGTSVEVDDVESADEQSVLLPEPIATSAGMVDYYI